MREVGEGKKKAMAIAPLRDGRESISDQAGRRHVDVPVGSTVEELRNMGYDVDPDWPIDAVLELCEESPTGYCIRVPKVVVQFHDVWALAY